MSWTSQRIRQQFMEFFEGKSHTVVPSAPMVIKNDPTLMFTNAGMNQFKEIFLGNTEPKRTRVADTQKCLRVSGKHNDLEEVGVDTYHHTMFEMLGNWSFGDYFKPETIDWAWELLTEVYGVDKDRLYATVFGGDEADGLGRDEEAFQRWKAFLPEDRILFCDKKDNFWEMGEVGPCGPCSEIHVDLRGDEERAAVDGATLVNQDHPQVIEVWNLVFMEFNRLSNGSLQPLPKKHIDTGMGLERLAMVLQGKTSNYDTDLFQPLIRQIATVSGQTYGAKDSPEDIAMRVIADHVRAIAFAIADGQLPSNTGAGYVIRRILRRAVRYAYSFLNQREAFIHDLIPVLVEVMGDKFPELSANRELMGKVIREEEDAFLRTLDRGIVRFEQYLTEHPNGKDGKKTMDGQFVFELYDTFGFPRDLTELMARERGWQVDEAGFQEQIGQQKARSRKAAKVDTGDWTVLSEEAGNGFVGYDTLEATVHIRQYRQVQAKGKSWYQLVFDQTPFYAEGGGQVGDTGFIEAGGKRTFILDTKKENNLIVHRSESLPENLEASFRAAVDAEKRRFTENNHSATHLLHRALRTVLGTHVEQRGSLVDQKHLRFDFSHFAKVDEEQLAQIEAMVNNEVRQNLALDDQREVPIEQAMAQGAMALFGEKYGDHVRVVRFGESVELCGGTHASATGQLGLFKIISEGAVAAGIRRIEAITADQAETYVNEQLQLLKAVKQALKNPRDVQQAVTSLLHQQDKLSKRLEQLNREKAGSYKDTLLAKAETINGATFIAARVDLEMGAIKDLAFQLRAERDDLFLLLGSESNGKGQLTLALSDNLVSEKSMDAAKIIRDLARSIKGGGGGQPFFATAGGKDPSGLEAAFEQARGLF